MSPGETKRFVWRVTPVAPGTHRLRLRVAAGLAGRAKAVLAGNRAPERELTVRISSRPARARVGRARGPRDRRGRPRRRLSAARNGATTVVASRPCLLD
jgi:hypothetical protein